MVAGEPDHTESRRIGSKVNSHEAKYASGDGGCSCPKCNSILLCTPMLELRGWHCPRIAMTRLSHYRPFRTRAGLALGTLSFSRYLSLALTFSFPAHAQQMAHLRCQGVLFGAQAVIGGMREYARPSPLRRHRGRGRPYRTDALCRLYRHGAVRGGYVRSARGNEDRRARQYRQSNDYLQWSRHFGAAYYDRSVRLCLGIVDPQR